MFGMKKRKLLREQNIDYREKVGILWYEELPRVKERVAPFKNHPTFKIKKTAEGFFVQTLRPPRDSDYAHEARKLSDDITSRYHKVTDEVYSKKFNPETARTNLQNLETRIKAFMDLLLSIERAEELFLPRYATAPGKPFPNLSKAMEYFNESLREDGFNEVWMDSTGTVVKDFGCSPPSS